MSIELTWGILIIGVGIAAAWASLAHVFTYHLMQIHMLYGISTAQTFYYYRNYGNDPLYTRALTGTVWILNTVHLGLIIHIPWYYLIDGSGGVNDTKLVWSWPVCVIVTVLTALPVYVFYTRRIRILGGQPWLYITVLTLGLTHFAMSITICTRMLMDGRMAALNEPKNVGFICAAFAFGTATDVGIAVSMCWLLAKSRTGHPRTDGTLSLIMLYSINSGLLIALCVVAGLISGLVAKTTQFEIFFLYLLPELYANSYLGSLNSRKAFRAHLADPSLSTSRQTYALGDMRSPPATPNTAVDIERTSQLRKGNLTFSFD